MNEELMVYPVLLEKREGNLVVYVTATIVTCYQLECHAVEHIPPPVPKSYFYFNQASSNMFE